MLWRYGSQGNPVEEFLLVHSAEEYRMLRSQHLERIEKLQADIHRQIYYRKTVKKEGNNHSRFAIAVDDGEKTKKWFCFLKFKPLCTGVV